jgi:hypothetical protein
MNNEKYECAKSVKEDKLYGIICEWKNEGPLIMEGKPMTYEETYKRMEMALKESRIIRAAIFSMDYESGNETLLPPKPKPMPF